MNPQFVIKLEEEDDDPDDGEVGCSFVVGLIQKNRRKLRKQGEDMHTVGFAIYEVRAEEIKDLKDTQNVFFWWNDEATSSLSKLTFFFVFCFRFQNR